MVYRSTGDRVFIMGYEYDEKGRIIYFDDSIDIGKEPLPRSKEHEEISRRLIAEIKKEYNLK